MSLLLAAGVHIGHSKSLWDPRTQPFIYGIRENLHIISLDVTLPYLRRACAVVRDISKHYGIIVFVGTRSGQERIVIEAAKRAKGYHVFDRWLPGTITNSAQVLSGGKIAKMEAASSSKKVIPQNGFDEENLGTDTEMPEGDRKNSSNVPPAIKPDLVIVLNPLENKIALQECANSNVPTIGIIDTDSDPTAVTYAVPGNDDSHRSVALIAGILSNAAAEGVKLRENGRENSLWNA